MPLRILFPLIDFGYCFCVVNVRGRETGERERERKSMMPNVSVRGIKLVKKANE